MKLWRQILALMMSMVFALAGVQASVVGYTEGTPITATRRAYKYDNNRLLIGAYYGDEAHVSEAAEAGLDFFITNQVTESFLDACAEKNMGIIAQDYNLPSCYFEIPDGALAKWKNVDLTAYKDHPALWGDDIIDEPGSVTYDRIAECLEGYYKAVDDKIALVNLFPIYADEPQLTCKSNLTPWQKFMLLSSDHGSQAVDRYKQYVSNYINTLDTDYICVDIYPYNSKLNAAGNEVKYTNRDWIRNLDILAEAARETGRDLWIITQAAGNTEHGTETGERRYCDEVSDISQQAFASLAFGAKAIVHAEFSARGWWDPATSHMIDADGNTTATYDAVKTTNEYMKSFAEEYGKYTYTGTYAMNARRVAGLTGSTLCTEVPAERGDFRSANGLLVGTFRGENGEKGYILANMEELNLQKTATVRVPIPAGKTATVYQQGKSATLPGGKTGMLTLTPGEGVFITMQ